MTRVSDAKSATTSAHRLCAGLFSRTTSASGARAETPSSTRSITPRTRSLNSSVRSTAGSPLYRRAAQSSGEPRSCQAHASASGCTYRLNRSVSCGVATCRCAPSMLWSHVVPERGAPTSRARRGLVTKTAIRPPRADEAARCARGVARASRPRRVRGTNRAPEEPAGGSAIAPGGGVAADLHQVPRTTLDALLPQIGEGALLHRQVGAPLLRRSAQAVGATPVVPEWLVDVAGPLTAHEVARPQLVVLAVSYTHLRAHETD